MMRPSSPLLSLLPLLLLLLLLASPTHSHPSLTFRPTHKHLARSLHPASSPPPPPTNDDDDLPPPTRTLRTTTQSIRRPRSERALLDLFAELAAATSSSGELERGWLAQGGGGGGGSGGGGGVEQAVLGADKQQPTSTLSSSSPRALASLIAAGGGPSGWTIEQVTVPDLDDMATLVNLAKMANDAYASPGEPRWMELDRFNLSLPFGWEPDHPGLRGHVFASDDNATLVVSFKGTSVDGPVPPRGGGSTAKLDQVNDNLFFSCCCGSLPSAICSCAAPPSAFSGLVSSSFSSFPETDDDGAVDEALPGGRSRRGRGRGKPKTCDEGCLSDGLLGPESYYPAAVALYVTLRLANPDATIWLTGHSLGAAVASLVGLTFGLPTVGFESPPDRLVVDRLGLGLGGRHQEEEDDERWNPVTHVFHTGDMIAVGACRGPLSACGRGGYVMDSSCKQGRLRVYETVDKWGWKVDRTGRSHTIQWVIDNVYSKPWNEGEVEGPEGRGRDWTDVPRPTYERADCVDCAGWTFV